MKLNRTTQIKYMFKYEINIYVLELLGFEEFHEPICTCVFNPKFIFLFSSAGYLQSSENCHCQ